MSLIFFLSSFDKEPTNDNLQRFASAFQSLGWDVKNIDHESLAIKGNSLYGLDSNLRSVALSAQPELIWLIGFGEQTTFLDRMQWLRSLPQNLFVNGVDSLVYCHGKPYFLLTALGSHHPYTVVGGSKLLLDTVEQGGSWIAKPNAGSFGRDVFRVSAKDPNYRVIIENLTAFGSAILQKMVDTGHEKRVLLAGGEIIGSYGKKPFDHRGNVAAGSTPTATDLDSKEQELARHCAQNLLEMNVSFATLDMAYPFILDINIANPGWLHTFEEITQQDLTLQVVTSIIRKINSRSTKNPE